MYSADSVGIRYKQMDTLQTPIIMQSAGFKCTCSLQPAKHPHRLLASCCTYLHTRHTFLKLFLTFFIYTMWTLCKLHPHEHGIQSVVRQLDNCALICSACTHLLHISLQDVLDRLHTHSTHKYTLMSLSIFCTQSADNEQLPQGRHGLLHTYRDFARVQIFHRACVAKIDDCYIHPWRT